MITYILQHDKSLVQSVGGMIYQGENLVDKVMFIVPKEYEGLDMTEFKYYLRYVTLDNKIHNELLTIDNDDYKDKYMTFNISVNSKIATFADELKIKLIVTKDDTEIFYSGDSVIKINPIDIAYAYNVSSSEGVTPTPSGDIPNGLKISDDGKKIYLTKDGIVVGTPIDITNLVVKEVQTTNGETFKIGEI